MKIQLAFTLILVFIFTLIAEGQQTVKLQVISAGEKSPLFATVKMKPGESVFKTDSAGNALVHFAHNEEYTLTISSASHSEKIVKVTIPATIEVLLVELESNEEELEEVIIQSTRTSRTIANVPTRVETIELEEIDEKSNMRPANVAMLLHESTGIQVQQTSATSGNASIRIQGLDGRYTQLLKDGFAAFGNFASGLSVLEIPPLDLKQVEIIKVPVPQTIKFFGAVMLTR